MAFIAFRSKTQDNEGLALWLADGAFIGLAPSVRNLDAFEGQHQKGFLVSEMANIAVLESHQSDTDLPTGGRIKRSAGYSLVNRGEAYWVKKPLLLKRIAAPAPRAPGAILEPRAYIPDELPPAEVHGCTFDDPVLRANGILPFTRLWAESQEADFCRA